MVSHEPAVLPAALPSLVASEGRLYVHIHVYITSRNADFIRRYSLTFPPNADNHLCNHHCGICAYPRGCARTPTAKLIRTFLIAALCIHPYRQPPLQSLAFESLLCQLQHGSLAVLLELSVPIGMPTVSSARGLNWRTFSRTVCLPLGGRGKKEE
jgi:hypothetical protein